MDSYHQNKEAFKNGLLTIQDELVQNGIDYRILGSIAAASYIDRELNFNREHAYSHDQRYPDIDILVPRDSYAYVKGLRKKYMGQNFPIFLGITPALTEIDFRPNSDTSFLVHRDGRFPVSTDVFLPSQQLFTDVNINTVNIRTLVELYKNGEWLRRKKDDSILNALQEQLVGTIDQISEMEYMPFEQYREWVKKRALLYSIGKYALERTFDTINPRLANAVRHYGSKVLIDHDLIRILAYKPM